MSIGWLSMALFWFPSTKYLQIGHTWLKLLHLFSWSQVHISSHSLLSWLFMCCNLFTVVVTVVTHQMCVWMLPELDSIRSTISCIMCMCSYWCLATVSLFAFHTWRYDTLVFIMCERRKAPVITASDNYGFMIVPTLYHTRPVCFSASDYQLSNSC